MNDENRIYCKNKFHLVLCEIYNNQIDNLINNISDEKKIEFKIDDNNTYIIGKYGPVIKCMEEINGKQEITFKPVSKDIDICKIQNGDYTLQELIDSNKTISNEHILGQYNGVNVYIKKGKYGPYIMWDNNKQNLKEFGNRPIENITFDEIKKYLIQEINESKYIRDISPNISIRKGPKGDYIFYKMDKMKRPQFFDLTNFYKEEKEDYKICDINILKSWIKKTYNVY